MPRRLEEPSSSYQPKLAAPGGDTSGDVPHEPAERQADVIGERIGQELEGTGPITAGALPERIRGVAERHLGVDLSGAELRADGQAAEHAAGMNAVAVTEGATVSFARSELSLDTREGRSLLGHELTHVAQQKVSGRRASQRRPARPAPPIPAPPTETIPSTRPPPDAHVGGPRYVPQPSDMSFDARLERAKLQDLRERQIEQAERPFAVLDRGGSSAQGFITEGSRGTAIDQFGQYSFRQRRFHVLDAITWRVSGAETTRNLLEIVWAYIPEITPQLQPANRPPGGVPPFLDPSAPRFLATMDPQGVARLQVFMQAVKARGIALPDPRVQAIPLKRVMDLMSPVPEIQSGACDVGPVPRAGGHPPHDKYATAVTGSTMDFMVRSPEGKDCQTDGLDRAGVTWEVKTGHLILAETRLGSLSEERLRQIADRVEEQRVRCLFATSRCGYPYVWAFTDPFVVEYFNELWGGTPRVVCRTEQGARC